MPEIMDASSRTTQQNDVKLILLVEDDDLFRRAMSVSLLSQGYEVLTARSAEDALERFGTEPIDLAVTDYRLPGMNGIDLVKTLRSNGHRIPGLLVTGYLSAEVRELAHDANINAFLTKPFDLGCLREMVSVLLSAPGS